MTEKERTLADYDRELAELDRTLAADGGSLNERDRNLVLRTRQELEHARYKFIARGRRGNTVVSRG